MDINIGYNGSSAGKDSEQGTTSSPPSTQGALPDLQLQRGVAIAPVLLFTGFSGTEMSFGLAPSSAALPTGLSLSLSGILSGTPAETVTSLGIVIRASNAYGFADSGFSLSVATPTFTAAMAGTTSVPGFGASALDQTMLEAKAWGFSGNAPASTAYQWKTVESGNIAGATSANLLASAVLYDGESLYCTISPDGYEPLDTPSHVIRYTAPEATGALFDDVLDQFTGLVSVPTRTEFSGDALTYRVSGPASVTIDSTTGVIEIDTDIALAGDLVTVSATNSGGSASLSFLLTVEASGDVLIASFGALTLAGAGGIDVTGSSIVTGDSLGHWQIVGGRLSPSASGQGNIWGDYDLTLDNGQVVSIAVTPDAFSARADKAEIEAAHVHALATRAELISLCTVREGSTSAVIDLTGNAMPNGAFVLRGEGFSTNGSLRPSDYDWGVTLGGVLMDGQNIHIEHLAVFSPKAGPMAGIGCVSNVGQIDDFSIRFCHIHSTDMATHVEEMLAASDPQIPEQVAGIDLIQPGVSGSNGVIESCWLHDVRYVIGANVDNLLVDGVESADSVEGWIVNINSGATGMIIRNCEHHGMWASIDDPQDQHSGMGGGSLVSGETGNTGKLIGCVVSNAGWRRRDYEASQGRGPINMSGTTGFKLNDPLPKSANGYDGWEIKHNLFQLEQSLGMTVENGRNIDWAYNTLVGDPVSGVGSPTIYMDDQDPAYTDSTNLRAWRNIVGGMNNNGLKTHAEKQGVTQASFQNIQIANGAIVQPGVTAAREYSRYFEGHPQKGFDRLFPDELMIAFTPKAGTYAALAGIGAINGFYQPGLAGKGATDTAPAYAQPTSAGNQVSTGHAYSATVWDGFVGLALADDATHGSKLTLGSNVLVPNGKQLLVVGQLEVDPAVDTTQFTLFEDGVGGLTIARHGTYRSLRVTWNRPTDNSNIVLFDSWSEFTSDDGKFAFAMSLDTGNDRLCLAVNGVSVSSFDGFQMIFNNDFGDFQASNVHLLESVGGTNRFTGTLDFFGVDNRFVDLDTDAGLESLFAADGKLLDLRGAGFLIALAGTAANFNTGNGNQAGRSQAVTITAGAVQDAGGDVSPPTLSNPADSANGFSGSTGSVTTNEDNGLLYWVVSHAPTSPTAAQVAAGLDHTGAVAAASGSLAVSAVGTYITIASGLATLTTYYTHFMHQDATGNQSAVASTTGFTTGQSVANLIVNSQDLTAPGWSASVDTLVSMTGADQDPLGGTGANRLWHSTSSSNGIQQMVSGLTIGQTYNVSFFAKANGSNVNPRCIFIGSDDVWWNVDTGLVTRDDNTPGNASITDVGGGWYRCAFTNIASSTVEVLSLLVASANSSTVEGIGDGTIDYLSVFGVQITEGASLHPYVAT